MNLVKYFSKQNNIYKWFKWEINIDLLVAIITLILTAFAYYGNGHWFESSEVLTLLIFIIGTNIVVNVIFPIWWVAFYRKQSLADLGVTKKGWIMSIGLGIILALIRSYHLPALVNGINWVPHIIFSAIILWEPFFVFGWLQSRYEKAFGVLPGILLAAFSMAFYHIGTYPFHDLIKLFLIYLISAACYRIKKNLLVLWPVYWSISSSVNSLSGGMRFGWDAVVVYSVVLAIQLCYLCYALKKSNAREKAISSSILQ